MRILMSAATSAAATSIVRHLQSLGHFVIGMDANPLALEFGRQLCDRFVLSPLAVRPDFADFLASLSTDFDLFIPFLDEELYLFALQKLPEVLAAKTLLCDLNTLTICLDKTRFQNFCFQRNLAVAPTAIAPPAVYKPPFGRGGKGVVMIDDDFMFTHFAARAGVLQQRIVGTEYTVDVLFDQSATQLFALPRKRLETAGVSRIGEIDFCEPVLALVAECAAAFKFHYAINIQIILDAQGVAHLIEINPRLAGSVMFSVMAGFDFLDNAINVFTGQKVIVPAREQIRRLRIVRHWTEVALDVG